VAQGRVFREGGIGDRSAISPDSANVTANRRLAAILAADVAGYSRLMGAEEEGTLNRLKAHRRELVDPKIREHRGRIVKTTGDGMLVEFSSVVDAVRCAVEIQRAMIDRNAGEPEDKRITFRIGVNLGDVIADGDDIYGDGVNIAARLEALAEPGGICISRTVRDHIGDRLPYIFDDIGEQSVKNIAQPVHAYAMSTAAVVLLPEVTIPLQPSGPSRRNSTRLAVLVASIATAIGIGIATWWVWPKGNSSAVPAPASIATSVQRPPAIEAKSAPRLSIVVLPFQNLSNDPDQEYFADGITDDLTSDLSRISGSFVIARTTAFTYKGKSIDVKQIGRELGVHYVLEGGVRRTGDQVRVNAQLIDAESGAHLWADRFDTNRAKLVEAQNEIIGRLAWTLNIAILSDASHRIEHENAVNPDARDLVMRGWALWYGPQSSKVAKEALGAFEHALEIDPRSTDARLGIARVLIASLPSKWSTSALQQDAVQQDIARAERLLIEAIESDPNRPMAYAIMGFLRRFPQGRLTESRIALEKAITLDPNFEWANMQLGWTLLALGRPGDAIDRGEKSLRLSPSDPNIFFRYQLLGWCQLISNHVDEAIDLFIKARTANPRLWDVSFGLAAALALKGDLDGAKAALAESLKLRPEVNSLAQLYAWTPWASKKNAPQYWALQDKTLSEGLRRIGFPEK
jgi:TolB-like protein/class 3 adenylate cyclase/Tfp pilus assembly protein PilF